MRHRSWRAPSRRPRLTKSVGHHQRRCSIRAGDKKRRGPRRDRSASRLVTTVSALRKSTTTSHSPSGDLLIFAVANVDAARPRRFGNREVKKKDTIDVIRWDTRDVNLFTRGNAARHHPNGSLIEEPFECAFIRTRWLSGDGDHVTTNGHVDGLRHHTWQVDLHERSVILAVDIHGHRSGSDRGTEETERVSRVTERISAQNHSSFFGDGTLP